MEVCIHNSSVRMRFPSYNNHNTMLSSSTNMAKRFHLNILVMLVEKISTLDVKIVNI